MTGDHRLSHQIAGLAHGLGFGAASISQCREPSTIEQYRSWLRLGYHGSMEYLARPEAIAKREDPSRILEGARSVICVAANYHTSALSSELLEDPSRGIIASYATRRDYHDIVLSRLKEIESLVQSRLQGPVAFRSYVDTGPLLERDLAAQGGLGFIGKNTNLIIPGLGSWYFLGEILLTADLEPLVSVPGLHSRPLATGQRTCGKCTRCLDACPTGALVAPYVLDSRRCISYLTIELKGPVPRELRGALGNHVFGCDICQQVCPWNRRFARPSVDQAFSAPTGSFAPELVGMMGLTAQGFRARFSGSPLERTRRRGLLRNVAIALGNWGDPAAIAALRSVLKDPEPLIRGHASWALSQIGTYPALQAIQETLTQEDNAWVRTELERALEHLASGGRETDRG